MVERVNLIELALKEIYSRAVRARSLLPKWLNPADLMSHFCENNEQSDLCQKLCSSFVKCLRAKKLAGFLSRLKQASHCLYPSIGVGSHVKLNYQPHVIRATSGLAVRDEAVFNGVVTN